MKCAVCHRPAAEMHEIFYGNGLRELSIKYGYQVPVCRSCHEVCHLRTLGAGLFSPLQEFDKKPRRKKWIQMRLCKLAGLDFRKCQAVLRDTQRDKVIV